jgi:hypothetical protein
LLLGGYSLVATYSRHFRILRRRICGVTIHIQYLRCAIDAILLSSTIFIRALYETNDLLFVICIGNRLIGSYFYLGIGALHSFLGIWDSLGYLAWTIGVRCILAYWHFCILHLPLYVSNVAYALDAHMNAHIHFVHSTSRPVFV